MSDDSQKRDNLRVRLTNEQFEITQNKGTEPASTGKYVDHKEAGTYQCLCCGKELFSSGHKFDSGSGWPSFWSPLVKENIKTVIDTDHGMTREEVICRNCGAHLGHVFEDGPQPTGLRYCINSASLDFEKSS